MHAQAHPTGTAAPATPGDVPADPNGLDPRRVLGAVRESCSIDAIAARLNLTSIKHVLHIKSVLRDLAARGHVQDLGNGMWGTGASADDGREAATAQDVLVHGFGDGAGPATIQRIADNVEAATGRDTSRISELVMLLLDLGKLRPSRSRCYALTERAMAEIEAHGSTGPGGVQEKILAAVPETGDVGLGEILKAAGNRGRLAQAALRGLMESGVIIRIDGPRGSRYARTGGEPDDLALRIRMSGPALRRAMAALSSPLTQRELAAALGVTRERARQIANTLVERGLARSFERRVPGVAATRVYVAGTAPGEVSLEDSVMASMPADVLVSPDDVSKGLNRHPKDVAEAFGVLTGRQAVSAVRADVRRVLFWRADGGAPSADPFPPADLDWDDAARTVLETLAAGASTLPQVREALERSVPGTWSSERASTRVATLARSGLLTRERGESGRYEHAITPDGEKVLATLRAAQGDGDGDDGKAG